MMLSAFGIIDPLRRGNLIMMQLVLYALNGPVGGYVAARYYQTFKGKSFQKATVCTAIGFPGIALGLWLFVDAMLLWQGSSLALPAMTIGAILLIWLLSAVLVFAGAHFGYKRVPIEFPVSTSNVPRRIPPQSWLRSLAFSVFMASLQFIFLLVEFCHILFSVWHGPYYDAFGFLLLASVTLVLHCAMVSVILNYLQLCGLWGELPLVVAFIYYWRLRWGSRLRLFFDPLEIGAITSRLCALLCINGVGVDRAVFDDWICGYFGMPLVQ